MKHKIFLLVLLLTMMTTTYVFADDGPGEPCTEEGSDASDPFDNNCPLDSWVYMLALAPVTVTLASVFAKSEEDEDKKLPEEDEN